MYRDIVARIRLDTSTAEYGNKQRTQITVGIFSLSRTSILCEASFVACCVSATCVRATESAESMQIPEISCRDTIRHFSVSGTLSLDGC